MFACAHSRDALLAQLKAVQVPLLLVVGARSEHERHTALLLSALQKARFKAQKEGHVPFTPPPSVEVLRVDGVISVLHEKVRRPSARRPSARWPTGPHPTRSRSLERRCPASSLLLTLPLVLVNYSAFGVQVAIPIRLMSTILAPPDSQMAPIAPRSSVCAFRFDY